MTPHTARVVSAAGERMGTVTLTEFLLARIAEDEAVHPEYGWLLNAEPHTNDCAVITWLSDYNPSCDCDGPKRWLAECEAKRRIVEEYQREEWVIAQGHFTEWTQAGQAARETALKYLAAIYADHPDYLEEWRP